MKPIGRCVAFRCVVCPFLDFGVIGVDVISRLVAICRRPNGSQAGQDAKSETSSPTGWLQRRHLRAVTGG